MVEVFAGVVVFIVIPLVCIYIGWLLRGIIMDTKR